MMGLFEHWPYVNFHDLNLDWIIKEIPKVFKSRDEAQASAESSAESAAASQLSADASLASQEAAHQSELNAAQSETDAAGYAQDALNTVTNTLNQINLLQRRVDNIIPSGTQTEGNTELLDIRVGANGVIYQSAGDAVRALDSFNGNEINENSNVLSLINNIVIPFYISDNNHYIEHATGNVSGSTSTTYNSTDFINIGMYEQISYKRATSTSPATTIGIAFYDINKNFISGIPNIGGQSTVQYASDLHQVLTPPNAVYARFSTLIDTTTYGSFELYGVLSKVKKLSNDNNEKISYVEFETDLKNNNVIFYTGYMGTDGTIRTDLQRGIFTDFINYNDLNYVIKDNDFDVRFAFYDENNNFVRMWYDQPHSETFVKARAFIVPLRTNGNSTATDAEIIKAYNTTKILTREELNSAYVKKKNVPYKVVDKNGTGDYTSIAEAVSAAIDGETIFIRDGEYKETVIVNKYVHLVGESKQNTILYNDIGDYDNAPLLITQGSVCNMTIKSLAPADTTGLTNYAYAIHLDKNFASDPKYQKCEIYNCFIYSEVNDAVGAGTNYASVYDIHDCLIHVAHNPVKTGACGFKCHNGQYQTTGKVILKNNVIMTEDANGTSCYDILYHNGGISNINTIDILQVGNVLKYYRNNITNIFVPSSYNFGNSVSEMNTL